jgi:uncharacterized protein YecE (DUF72 family)
VAAGHVASLTSLAIHIGTSGWSYPHWNGVLYPPGTSSAARLDVYTKRFDTVELNASFYHWPRDSGFASWRQRLPAGFQLSVKAPRGLTHGGGCANPKCGSTELVRVGIRWVIGAEFFSFSSLRPTSGMTRDWTIS